MAQKKLGQAPRGRPPLAREKARRNRVVTFLTDTELAALKTLAAARSDTLSGACYQLLKAGLARSASRGSTPEEE